MKGEERAQVIKELGDSLNDVTTLYFDLIKLLKQLSQEGYLSIKVQGIIMRHIDYDLDSIKIMRDRLLIIIDETLRKDDPRDR